MRWPVRSTCSVRGCRRCVWRRRMTRRRAVVDQHFGRQRTAVVVRRHRRAVRAGIADRQEVADGERRQHAVAADDVGAFAHRAVDFVLVTPNASVDAGQPQKVLQPEQRRIADAGGEQAAADAMRARDARAMPRSAKPRSAQPPQTRARARRQARPPRRCDRLGPPSDASDRTAIERHARRAPGSAAAPTADPRPRRSSPACHVARPPSRTSAMRHGFTAGRRRQVARRDAAERRQRGAPARRPRRPARAGSRAIARRR